MAADRAVSVAKLIRHLKERRARNAESLLEGGLSYEDYLIGTGKFRESRSLIQVLEKLIEGTPSPEAGRVLEADEDDADVDETGDDDEDAPQPGRRMPVGRRQKAHPWGGR